MYEISPSPYTVGNRVDEIPGSDFPKFCFLMFFPIVNTPTKKKPHHKTPCCPPLFWYLSSKSKFWRNSWSFFTAEGSTLDAYISSSVHNLFSMYIHVRKVFGSAFQWCTWKFYLISSFQIIEENVEKIVKKLLNLNFRGPDKICAGACRGDISKNGCLKVPLIIQKKNHNQVWPSSRDIWLLVYTVMYMWIFSKVKGGEGVTSKILWWGALKD
jgi:hypothetical protein